MMNSIPLVQIVPDFAPAINAVGRLAGLVAEEWHRQGLPTGVCITNPLWKTSEVFPFRTFSLSAGSENELLGRLSEEFPNGAHLLIHYVNWSYAPGSGCPFWLLTGLRAWKRLHPPARVGVYFHELFSFSSPMKKSFWTHVFQRLIARKVARASDWVFAGLGHYAAKCREWGSPCSHLPLISTIGEVVRPFESQRFPVAVAFGLGREHLFHAPHQQNLLRVCRAFHIEKVLDVGPRKLEISENLGEVKVDRLGIIPESDISRYFSTSRLGLIRYPEKLLGKSSVFAAYCAHGLPVVNFSYEDHPFIREDTALRGLFIRGEASPQILQKVNLPALGNCAWRYYQPHRTEFFARELAERLFNRSFSPAGLDTCSGWPDE